MMADKLTESQKVVLSLILPALWVSLLSSSPTCSTLGDWEMGFSISFWLRVLPLGADVAGAESLDQI